MNNISILRKIFIKSRLLLSNSIIAESWRQKQRRRILTRAFILSNEYRKIINKYYNPEIDGVDSAELLTKNFKYRHFKKNKVLGAWRWLGVYEKRNLLQKYVFSDSLTGLDVGGARGPISLRVDICDRLKKDIFNRLVKYDDISNVPDRSLDYIWSSHTLEHIPDLDGYIEQLSNKLKKEGKLMVLVPAYTCRRWRAGLHQYKDSEGASPHTQTFCLSAELNRTETAGCCAIDQLVGSYLTVEMAELVGDNSIFIYAVR